MRTILPRCEVRYGLKDLWIALTDFHSGPLRDHASWLPGFEDRFSVFPTWRGREALAIILKALGLRVHANIGVPLFACSVVAKTILACGMRPVFIDADPETFGLSMDDLKKKASLLDAVVLVHLCGYPADYDRVAELLGEKPIIEDCAHALGSFYKGRPLGSLGRVSFFSFGFFKPFGIGGGGCAVTGDLKLSEKLDDLLRATREKIGLAHAARAFCFATTFRRPIYSLLQSFRPDPGKSVTEAEYEGTLKLSSALRMRGTDWKVVVNRMGESTTRLSRVSDYWTELRQHIPKDCFLPPEPDCGEWNHFILALRADSPEGCRKIVATFLSRGISAAPLYPARAIALKGCGYQGDCPRAERLSHTLMMLPSHSGLRHSDKKRVLEALDLVQG
jgi:perosamine synthetase